MIKIIGCVLSISLFSIIIVSHLYCFQIDSAEKDSLSLYESHNKQANELFEEAMEQYEEGELDSAVVLLKKAIKIDEDFAEAYDRLALMYVEKKNVYSRVLAIRAIKKAIELKPDEIKYKVHHGDIILEQEFIYNATKKFEYVTSLDSTNTESYLNLGKIYFKDAEKYKNMLDCNPLVFVDKNLSDYILNYDESGKRLFGVRSNYDEEIMKIIDFSEYAKEAYEKALSSYAKALKAEPENKDALHNMSLLAMEANKWDLFIEYQKNVIKYYPDDKNAHLFLAFGYHNQKKYDMAYSEYMKAKELMEPDEKELFKSIDYIIPAGDVEEYKNMTPAQKSEYKKKFWKQRDPLFMSSYNERELEHYSRVAYANIKFSVKKMNLPGWKTDRGMIYIRYGSPNNIFRENGLRILEIWYYDEFTFSFKDKYQTGRYILEGDGPFLIVDFPEVARIEYEKRSEKYEHRFEGNKIDYDCYFVSFRGDNGKSLVNVYHAIPVNELEPRKEKKHNVLNLKEGLFVFNDNWDDVDKLITEEKIYLHPKLDSTENYNIIGMNQMELNPDEYNFAVEFQEEESKNTGTHRSKIKVDSYPLGKLNISDIVLASNIIPTSKESKYVRNGLKIIPNPKKTINQGQLMYIYFEIYNLLINVKQKTNFKVDYKISSEQKEKSGATKFFSDIGKLFGGKKGKQDITASYEYEGTNPTDHINLSIDMSDADLGKYELTVKVRDLNNKREMSKSIMFQVSADTVNYLF